MSVTIKRFAVAVSVWALLAGSPVLAQNAAPGTELLDYGSIHHPVRAERAMVVSQNIIASQVGADILRRGGNAIDAAVAVGFALAVTLPRAGNIGGDGFMLVYIAETGETVALDYRSMAPEAARVNMFRRDRGGDPQRARRGYQASGVPGTVAGLEAAHTRWGKLAWAEVVRPARLLAQEGVILSRDEADALVWSRSMWSAFEAGRLSFLKPDGSAYRAGERFQQTDLAWSLEQIERNGADAFYRGPIADRIEASMRRNNGLMTKADLAAYRPVFRDAISAEYRGHHVVTMPSSSAGGVALLEMLNIVENFDIRAMGSNSADSLHVMAEAMKLANLDRRRFIGDPDFSALPTERMISQDYSDQRAGLISLTSILPAAALVPLDPLASEGENTTHYSVVDAEGNVVSNTYTLGSSYGSGAVIDGAGFLLNDQMKNFNLLQREGGGPLRANGLEPHKRMVSSMSPAIVFRDGKPWLVTGTPGGATIPNTVFQMIVNMVDHDMNIAQATNTPRIHQDGPEGALQIEPGFSVDTARLLEGRGHDVRRRTTIGSVQSIVISPQGHLEAAADPRRPDAAAIAID